MDPSMPRVVEGWVSWVYEKKGMQDEAVRSDLKGFSQEISQAYLDTLRSAYHRGGWKAYQEARIEMQAPYADQICVPYDMGVGYLRLGDRDRAFAWFNKAIDHHCVMMINLKIDPLLDSIRSDPRYHQLLQRMKLAGSPSDGS
jgi:hypothetical protein